MKLKALISEKKWEKEKVISYYKIDLSSDFDLKEYECNVSNTKLNIAMREY